MDENPDARFQTVLKSEEKGPAFFIEVPAEIIVVLGARKRPPVEATLNSYKYRTTVSTYGGRYYLPVRREIREAAGLAAGSPVDVILTLDSAPRVANVPDDLQQALESEPEAMAAFQCLPYSHQREYAGWISEAKRDETRRRRIARAVAMLREGKKEP